MVVEELAAPGNAELAGALMVSTETKSKRRASAGGPFIRLGAAAGAVIRASRDTDAHARLSMTDDYCQPLPAREPRDDAAPASRMPRTGRCPATEVLPCFRTRGLMLWLRASIVVSNPRKQENGDKENGDKGKRGQTTISFEIQNLIMSLPQPWRADATRAAVAPFCSAARRTGDDGCARAVRAGRPLTRPSPPRTRGLFVAESST